MTDNLSKQLSEYTKNGQLLDLRPVTSWVQSIEDIDLTELSQVMIINSFIPYYLIQNIRSDIYQIYT
jgi:hypothetical protein